MARTSHKYRVPSPRRVEQGLSSPRDDQPAVDVASSRITGMGLRNLTQQRSSGSITPNTERNVDEHRVHSSLQLRLPELHEILFAIPITKVGANGWRELRTHLLLTAMLRLHLLELRHGKIPTIVRIDQRVMGRAQQHQVLEPINITLVLSVVTGTSWFRGSNVRLLPKNDTPAPLRARI